LWEGTIGEIWSVLQKKKHLNWGWRATVLMGAEKVKGNKGGKKCQIGGSHLNLGCLSGGWGGSNRALGKKMK